MSFAVSILVISYNTCELTRACLRSVLEQTRDLSFEVIVVDNASSDGSADMIATEFPAVLLVRATDNLGFARANNLAAARATGKYLLLLNPDTVVLDGAVQKLVRFAEEHPAAGIVGGRTLFADGSLNPSSCWARQTPWSLFCRGVGLTSLLRGHPWFDPESYGGWQRDSVREVDIVTGCLLLISRELWDRLGGFDARFFMYGEDADLCLRGKAIGCKPMITPAATIIHHGGASEPVRTDKLVRLLRAKAQLIKHHWRPAPARFGIGMLFLWALSRAIACRLLGRRPGAETWGSVWRRRREWVQP
ncbi:MAG: glycosyltransferase family 2 protein [Planctomycetota bacterium]